jgi:hypothetical protein
LFLQLTRKACKEQNEHFSTLETTICKTRSFEKLTELSQEICVDVAASNINDFPWRSACVFSTPLSRPIWSKQAYLHLDTPKLQEVFLSKQTHFSKGNIVLDAPDSKTDVFL